MPRTRPGTRELLAFAAVCLIPCSACNVGEGSFEFGDRAVSGVDGGTTGAPKAPPSGGSASPRPQATAGAPSSPGVCGNGIIDSGEDCDDAGRNGSAPGACRANCLAPACGDGVADPGEACDGTPGCSRQCELLCTSSATDGCSDSECGNGLVEGSEECDGGLACSVECLRVWCGDGRQDDGEECDPPLPGVCSDTCRSIRCGNDRLDPGEECEPPGAGACGETCLNIACGNARIDGEEECDPPAAGACTAACESIICGNQRVDEGEGCDPPASGSCDAECRKEGCGNGSIDLGEDCDPPLAGKCSGGCTRIECGNSRVDEGEECDPPVEGSCSAQCKRLGCGNGKVDPGEDCEPPGGPMCNDDCLTIRCGDGRKDQGELCEPTGSNDPNCTANCAPAGGGGSGGGTVLFGFDENEQNWKLYETSPASLGSGTSIKHDAQNGDVTPGALKVQAPFNDENQKIEFQVTFGTPLDLRGKTLRAKVRLGSGLSSDTTNPGGIKLFAKSGEAYDYASGEPTKLLQGASGWVDVTLVADNPIFKPGAFSPQQVRQIGFELRTFIETTNVSPAVVFIDSISY